MFGEKLTFGGAHQYPVGVLGAWQRLRSRYLPPTQKYVVPLCGALISPNSGLFLLGVYVRRG